MYQTCKQDKMYLVKGQLTNVKRQYVITQCCSTRSHVYSNTPMKTMSFNMLHGCSSLLPYNFIMHILVPHPCILPPIYGWNEACKHSTELGFHCSGLCQAWLECIFMVVDFPQLGWAWLELSPLDTYNNSKAKHKSSRKPLKSPRCHLGACDNFIHLDSYIMIAPLPFKLMPNPFCIIVQPIHVTYYLT